MINTYTFDYTHDNVERTKTIVTNSYESAMEIGELFLEDLNENLDLLGANSWYDVQDTCEKYGIYVDDLIEVIE